MKRRLALAAVLVAVALVTALALLTYAGLENLE